MAIQSFNIKYKGVDHPVEFEDDMEFGKFEVIIQKCSNFSEGTNPVDNVGCINCGTSISLLTVAD